MARRTQRRSGGRPEPVQLDATTFVPPELVELRELSEAVLEAVAKRKRDREPRPPNLRLVG